MHAQSNCKPEPCHYPGHRVQALAQAEAAIRVPGKTCIATGASMLRSFC
jgi:hypothetical protein